MASAHFYPHCFYFILQDWIKVKVSFIAHLELKKRFKMHFLQWSLGSVAWRLLSAAALGTHRGQISLLCF